MINAEMLFDLLPADYSDFIKIKEEYEIMEVLYKIFKQQKVAREGWSKTLWVNLNPQQLVDGMDSFIKEFKKLPRGMRQTKVGVALEGVMKDFKNSVPLFLELKNEAMRERHWLELMEKTGRKFDMAPER